MSESSARLGPLHLQRVRPGPVDQRAQWDLPEQPDQGPQGQLGRVLPAWRGQQDLLELELRVLLDPQVLLVPQVLQELQGLLEQSDPGQQGQQVRLETLARQGRSDPGQQGQQGQQVRLEISERRDLLDLRDLLVLKEFKEFQERHLSNPWINLNDEPSRAGSIFPHWCSILRKMTVPTQYGGMRKGRWLATLAGLWLASVAHAGSSASYQLLDATIDTSGGASASASYSMNGCIGASIAGVSVSASFQVVAGCGTIADAAAAIVAPVVPEVPVVPVVPLIPALTSLPVFPGFGSNRLTVLNLGEGAGPAMTGCLGATLSAILGAEWLYQAQSADGGARLVRSVDTISFYALDASSNTSYGLGQGGGVYLRNTNPLSVVTGCGTFLTVPAMYSLSEFGAWLNAGGLTAQINAQGVMTVQVGALIYVARPGYLVTQGTPGAPGLTTGADGLLRFTDSAGHVQILYPAFLDPETLGSQVSQAVGGYVLIQTDGTALVTLLNGQQFVLTPDLTLGTVPPGILGIWWQDGPNHYRFRNGDYSNTSQGFSVTAR